MKFAHLADVHIGSWRDAKLSDLSTQAFEVAMDRCMLIPVDFILISGDLFNTPLPSIDRLSRVVQKLKQIQEKGIRTYAIPGSHDYSPSGKTLIDVLEHAGLLINVVKGTVAEGTLNLTFTVDAETGVKITGLLGKRAALEKTYYEHLNLEALEHEPGFKIFMFHSAIAELMEHGLQFSTTLPLSVFPKGFDYYAGGHVHIIRNREYAPYGRIVYPGPVFPANFSELEELGGGGFFLYLDGDVTYERILLHPVHSIMIDAQHKSPEWVAAALREHLQGKEFFKTIVTIRVTGCLGSGSPGDIPFQSIIKEFYEKGAYFVMRNTLQLSSAEFKEVAVAREGTEDVEERIIAEHADQLHIKTIDPERIEALVHAFMRRLSIEKGEGENQTTFEQRVKKDTIHILEQERLI